ncbi:hypothetical protein A6033_17700 [Aeromonas veronii]|nr:hypothetical protein A6033_17700 [Aeromonas veronii]
MIIHINSPKTCLRFWGVLKLDLGRSFAIWMKVIQECVIALTEFHIMERPLQRSRVKRKKLYGKNKSKERLLKNLQKKQSLLSMRKKNFLPT